MSVFVSVSVSVRVCVCVLCVCVFVSVSVCLCLYLCLCESEGPVLILEPKQSKHARNVCWTGPARLSRWQAACLGSHLQQHPHTYTPSALLPLGCHILQTLNKCHAHMSFLLIL